jgi:hypothetical protein
MTKDEFDDESKIKLKEIQIARCLSVKERMI